MRHCYTWRLHVASSAPPTAKYCCSKHYLLATVHALVTDFYLLLSLLLLAHTDEAQLQHVDCVQPEQAS
jgi:hypothetical protein